MKSERKFSSIPVLLILILSSFAGFVNVVPFAEAANGDGVVLSYKPNVASTGASVTLQIQFKNDATDPNNCLDEIIIMAPDTPGNEWTGTAAVTKYDRSSFIYTNEETNDNTNLVSDKQSVRIKPDHSLCPGETVNIEIGGLYAPGNYEVSEFMIKTSDAQYPDYLPLTLKPGEAFPKVYVTKGTQLKLEYLHINNPPTGTGQFTATAWGADARLRELYVQGTIGASMKVEILTNAGWFQIYSGTLTGGVDKLLMSYSAWNPVTMDNSQVQSGYVLDGQTVSYKVTVLGAITIKGVKEEIRNDLDWLSSGLFDAVGTIITSGTSEQRNVNVQLVDNNGYDVNEQIPLDADTTKGTIVSLYGYMTDPSGNSYFSLTPDCDFGIADVTISTDPLVTKEDVTEKVGINAGPAVAYEVTEGKNAEVPADESQLIEVTLYDKCDNIITNTNKVYVEGFYRTDTCGSKFKLSQEASGAGSQDHKEEYTNMGVAQFYLKTDCQLCTHKVEIKVGNPVNSGENITMYGVANLPEKMSVTLNDMAGAPVDYITADQCIKAVVQVTDTCGNLVSEIPSEVGDEMEQWESPVRVTVDQALTVDQLGWASSSQTYIKDSDFREEDISNGGTNPYVQGKLHNGAGVVTICGCQGLGTFKVIAESDDIDDGEDSVTVRNAAWDCIETEIVDGEFKPIDQLLVCDEGAKVQVSIKDICGNYMTNQACGNGEANYCVDLSLSDTCKEDAAHLSTGTVCVNVGTNGPGHLESEFLVDLFRDTEECCEVTLDAEQGIGCCGPYPHLEQCDDSKLLFHGAPDYMTSQFYKTIKICFETKAQCDSQCPAGAACELTTENNHEVYCLEQLHEQIQDGGTEVVSEEVLDLFSVYDACGHIVKDFDGSIDVEKKNEDCASIYQVDHPLTLEEMGTERPGFCQGKVDCEDLTVYGEQKCLESNCDWVADGECSGVPECSLIGYYGKASCLAWGCLWDDPSSTCYENPEFDCADPAPGANFDEYSCNLVGCQWTDLSECTGSFGTCAAYDKEQCLMIGTEVEESTCEWFSNCNEEFKDSIIKKLVIHNCAVDDGKQWTDLEKEDIMVDKLAFNIDHEIDPSLWVYVYLEHNNVPGFQSGFGGDVIIGKAPMIFGGPTIIEVVDSPFVHGFGNEWWSRGWAFDDQREGGVLIRAGESKEFYIMLVNEKGPANFVIPCGTYSAQFLYYEDYTAMDFTEFGSGYPFRAADGGNVADGCIASDNFNWIDPNPRGLGPFCPNSGPGLNQRRDARNDDYRFFGPYPGPTPDYGFGDTYLDDLKFYEGQAWTKQRDLTAETVQDWISDIKISGSYCKYEEMDIDLELRNNPETITFIPQPATQVIAINHDGWSAKDVGCGDEAKPTNDQHGDPLNYFRINLQTADGFQNPVGKDIDVELEYCLKYPFGTWMIEDVVEHYCKKVENCKQGNCDIEECEQLWMDEEHCYTREELKELMKSTELFGEYFGDVIYDEFLGSELNAWIDSYFQNAKVHFWVDDGGWKEVTKVKTDLNGRAQVAVTAENPGGYKIIARPYALDADYTFVAFRPGVPNKLDVMAIPPFGVPADGEQEAMILVRALDQCDNLVFPQDYGDVFDDVTVSIDGKETYISEDFECNRIMGKNNYDNSVSTTKFSYGENPFGNMCLRALSDYPQTATITASGSAFTSDTTQIKFQGAPVKLAITKIEPSDRLPADGKTGAWVTIQVQDMLGNRVTGYLGNGFSGDPGDPWGMTDYLFNNICIDMDDALADHPNEWGTIPVWFMDVDDTTFGWVNFHGGNSMYCGDLMFGQGKIYVTLDNPDGGHGGTVQVKVWDKEQFQCQEINENGIPSSVKSTQCKPAMGEIDFVDPASQWNIWSDKQIVLADGKSKATISVQVENEYMDVRQAVDGNVYVGGTAAGKGNLAEILSGAKKGAVITWKTETDELNPTSVRMVTDPMTGEATLELTSTQPGIAEITVVGGRSYVCMGMDDKTLTECMERCTYDYYSSTVKLKGYSCREECLSGDYGYYNQASGEEYIPKKWCGYSESEQLTPKTITVEFIAVANNQVYLDKGWNFISTPYVLTNKQIGTLFAGLNVTSIYKWNAATQNFVALVLPTDPIDPLYGYWVKMGSPGVITYNYATPAMPSIPTRSLNVGWESFGLTANSPMSAENALMSVDSSYSMLIDWLESSQGYDLPVANTGENGGGMGPYRTGGYMAQPKQGYWLWVKHVDTLAGLSAYSG